MAPPQMVSSRLNLSFHPDPRQHVALLLNEPGADGVEVVKRAHHHGGLVFGHVDGLRAVGGGQHHRLPFSLGSM